MYLWCTKNAKYVLCMSVIFGLIFLLILVSACVTWVNAEAATMVDSVALSSFIVDAQEFDAKVANNLVSSDESVKPEILLSVLDILSQGESQDVNTEGTSTSIPVVVEATAPQVVRVPVEVPGIPVTEYITQTEIEYIERPLSAMDKAAEAAALVALLNSKYSAFFGCPIGGGAYVFNFDNDTAYLMDYWFLTASGGRLTSVEFLPLSEDASDSVLVSVREQLQFLIDSGD